VTPTPTPAPAPGPTATPTPAPTATPTPGPVSTVPTAPIAHPTDDVFQIGADSVYVPAAYDASNKTPISLLVWMHGCGGVSADELWNATVGDGQTYIGLAPGGADGNCWDVNSQPATVLAAIANLETHFNIDRRRIVLGGYSSGGDMSYRMALDHPSMFAGIIVENTTPFRDSGATAAEAQAASAKFPVVHLAHLQDDTYPISTVRSETNTLKAAGFPVTLIEKTGTHYDNQNDLVNGSRVPGTDADVKTYLLPHMTDGWLAATGS
ncbi:MAG: hypothetical protein AAGC46_10310, partial [Solirubrobacteraceae bacterium]